MAKYRKGSGDIDLLRIVLATDWNLVTFTRKALIVTISVALIFVISTVCLAQDKDFASVKGRVTTLRGDTLADVEVRFFQLEGIRGISPTEKLIVATKTDENGQYRVDNLPSGQYRVHFSMSGFGHTEIWRFYLWRNASRTLDIGIPVGYTHGLIQSKVSGSVRSSDGRSVENATVTLINAFDPNETQQTRTDKNGKFELSTIQPGQYIVYASANGFAVSASTFDLGNGARITSDFALKSIGKRALIDP
ncbi:MAG: carboxypeptidase-like regulatory domain-containing protein [Pyrinomonadaceae bacterium]